MKLATLADSEIMMTLTALACLLAGAFIVGKLFEKMQVPKVVGEIIGGMLFGGTFLRVAMPELMESIFNSFSEEGKVLNIFYQLGLSFLMFPRGITRRLICKGIIRGYFSHCLSDRQLFQCWQD